MQLAPQFPFLLFCFLFQPRVVSKRRFSDATFRIGRKNRRLFFERRRRRRKRRQQLGQVESTLAVREPRSQGQQEDPWRHSSRQHDVTDQEQEVQGGELWQVSDNGFPRLSVIGRSWVQIQHGVLQDFTEVKNYRYEFLCPHPLNLVLTGGNSNCQSLLLWSLRAKKRLLLSKAVLPKLPKKTLLTRSLKVCLL